MNIPLYLHSIYFFCVNTHIQIISLCAFPSLFPRFFALCPSLSATFFFACFRLSLLLSDFYPQKSCNTPFCGFSAFSLCVSAKPCVGREKNTEKKEDIIKNETPLSALFRKNSHEKLQTVLETWRPFLIGETEDVMKLNEFKFDLSRIQPSTVYLDLAQLINQGGLQYSMSVLAAYMFTHSNLSRSENALYVQLKRYKKLSE